MASPSRLLPPHFGASASHSALIFAAAAAAASAALADAVADEAAYGCRFLWQRRMS